MSTVSIVKTKDYNESNIDDAVRKSLELIGGVEDIIKPGYKVLIKPNLVALTSGRHSGATTHYEICKCIADIVMELGAIPMIAESAAAGTDTEKVIQQTKYDALRDQGYRVIDLKKTPKDSLVVESRKMVQTLASWEIVSLADVIVSVPVLKTHDQTEVTLGIKNLKGLIRDKQKKEFHRIGVFEGVVDIIQCLKPQLTIMDGLIGQEGLGPIFGEPVKLGLIIASKDIVAGDAVAGAVMGFDPEEIKTTKIAYERGLGEMFLNNIQIEGENLEDVRHQFRRASGVEIEGVPPFTLIDDPGACTGCRTAIISAIYDLKKDHKESFLEGKKFIIGPLPKEKLPESIKKEDLILVGLCTRHLAEYGYYVKGCPPDNHWIMKGVVGEEIKVKSRYDVK